MNETILKNHPTLERATLGGGCFWCLEAVYQQISGVSAVVSGYAGGGMPNPDYESVCSGQTGHAEIVDVYFDPTVVSYRDLLEIFFVIHDPTTLNYQGNDHGTQYRSVMFYADDSQKQLFEAAIDRARDLWSGQIVTELSPATEFWVGEEYHQDFFAKNPLQGYCNAVVAPKMAKVRKAFTGYLKP